MKSIINTAHLLIVSDDPAIIEALSNVSQEELLTAVITKKFRACFDALHEAARVLPSRIYKSRDDMPAWLVKLDTYVQNLCNTFEKNRVHGSHCKDMDVPGRQLIAAAKRLIEQLEPICNDGDATARKIVSNLKLLSGQLAIVVQDAEKASEPIIPTTAVTTTPVVSSDHTDANAPHNS